MFTIGRGGGRGGGEGAGIQRGLDLFLRRGGRAKQLPRSIVQHGVKGGEQLRIKGIGYFV